MTKSELVSNISDRMLLSKGVCEKFIDVFADEIKNCLVSGDKIIIKGFMGFEVNERPARDGRNPANGEIVTFPAVNIVKCKISKSIRDAVNGK